MPADSTPCESCQAPIMFGWTRGRKRMPLDAAPDPAGNVAAYRDGRQALVARVLKKGEEPLGYERRYMPHFATCTSPEAHRKRQAAAGQAQWRAAVADQHKAQRNRRGRRPAPEPTGYIIPPPALPGMEEK
jgi:hypothetical protein